MTNKSFRVYKYTEAEVSTSNLTATTTTKKEVSPNDIKIPKNELAVKLTVNGKTFNIDSSRWSFVDDTVNYVNNDRQITIQFGNVKASCNVEFYGAEPDPHAYKTVARDADKTGNLKVGETLHYNVKVTNEAATGSIWKNVTITDVIPFGLELVPNSVNLARTKTANNAANLSSISLSESKYAYNTATRTITLEIPYYVLNEQAYELTYDLKVAGTAIAGGEAGGANETRNLTNTVNVNGYDSDGKAYPCQPTACLPIPGETDPDNIKVEQVIPGSENDPDPDGTKEDAIEYLEHTKSAENMTDPRPGAVTQVWDIVKYTMTMKNDKEGAVFRNAQFVDEMPEGLEVILADANYPMTITKTSTLETDRAMTSAVADSAYDKASRTLAASAGDMFYGEEATFTFYAQVTPAALDGDIGNVGAIQAALPAAPGDEENLVDATDETEEPTYPEPEKDKPQVTEKEVTVTDPETGEPVIDPETGQPKTETVKETTGGVAACNPEPKVEKTIAVVSKKDGVEVTDANKNVPQVGDTVRTTVVISNDKEGSDWLDVKVDDACSDALILLPETIRVFDSEGNDVTEQVLKLEEGTQNIKLNIPSVMGGQQFTLQYDARVTSDAVNSLSPNQPNITEPVKVQGDSPDADDEEPVDAVHAPTNMARPGDPLDTVNKTMKVTKAAEAGTITVGDTLQYTIIAGNIGDKTTQALNPVVLDPLPEGIELTSQYVYVTKMEYNERTQEWEKASPSYVRKIARSNVYNESARTLVVAVGEVLGSGTDRVCLGETGYKVEFECTATSTAFATSENMGNIAYSESENPSEQPQAEESPAGDDPADDPAGDDPAGEDPEKTEPVVPSKPTRPTYPVDDDGDIVNPDGEKVLDPKGNPIKPTDTLDDHPSIPDEDIDDYIQNPKDPEGNPTDPTDPTQPIGAEPVRDPMRPVYPVDDDGDIVTPTGEKVRDPEGNPIKNTDRLKDHPSVPDEDIDDYIQKQIDPIPRTYPTDDEGYVIEPVTDPETGDPVVDPETGEPVFERVTDADGNPVKPDQTEVLEDLDVPLKTALHQVIKEVAKLSDNGEVAGKVTYNSGRTGKERVTTENDTSYQAGDKVNTTVTVKNLVEGTRWSGALVIDMPSNLVVTYYELVGPYADSERNSWGVRGQYGGLNAKPVEASPFGLFSLLASPSAAVSTATPTVTSSVARLSFNGTQFRLAASEIVGLEQYQVYYEGYVPENVQPGKLEDMIENPDTSNPLDDLKGDGPVVPENTPEGAKIIMEDPEEEEPVVVPGDPELPAIVGDTPTKTNDDPAPAVVGEVNKGTTVKSVSAPPVVTAGTSGKAAASNTQASSGKASASDDGTWGTSVIGRMLLLAQTGDKSFVSFAILALLAAGAFLVILVARRRKTTEEDEF